MMELYKDPIWDVMDWFFRPMNERKISDVGLKNVIHRPHNLINVENDEGVVIAQKLSVVTTPFKKDDVKVKVQDNTLTVTCGSENITDADNEKVVFRGISSQAYSFSVSLSNRVDQKKITAENKDGILTITLPLIVEEEKKSEAIEVQIA